MTLEPKKQEPHVPELFKEIVRVQDELDEVLWGRVVTLQKATELQKRLKELLDAAKQQYGHSLRGDKHV